MHRRYYDEHEIPFLSANANLQPSDLLQVHDISHLHIPVEIQINVAERSIARRMSSRVGPTEVNKNDIYVWY